MRAGQFVAAAEQERMTVWVSVSVGQESNETKSLLPQQAIKKHTARTSERLQEDKEEPTPSVDRNPDQGKVGNCLDSA